MGRDYTDDMHTMAEKRKCEQDMAKCTTDRKHYVELRCKNNDQQRSFKLRELRQEGTKEGRKNRGVHGYGRSEFGN
jgi:hypothetical protein